MEMSWSSWFKETIWLTISVGSTGEVGSWFCNSVTSRFRNVLCRSVDEVPDELLEFDEPVLPVAAVALAPCAWIGALIMGLNP
jgi:hypothetical protein